MVASLSSDLTTYNNIVLHHVPNALAPGLLAAMLVYALCLGAISWELILNIPYDFSLLRKPGWKEPVKIANRLCYYGSRYGAFVFLLITIVYMNLPGSNCFAYARAINVMWLLPLILVDFLFITRTLALYSWYKPLVLIMSFLYVTYVALCLYSVILFGDGYRIPGSSFCAYQTRSTRDQPHASIFIAYWTVCIFIDTMVRS